MIITISILVFICLVSAVWFYFYKYKNQYTVEIILDESIIFNVDNFNDWFNDKNNGSEYANSGIFLRLDKISEQHINEYLENRYKIKNFGPFLWSKPTRTMIDEFLTEIRNDWKDKLVNKITI